MFEVGDIVTIIVEHPYGANRCNVKNNVGVVTVITENYYEVTDEYHNDFLYAEDEIREATRTELEIAFKRMV